MIIVSEYTGEPSLTFNPCSDWKSWTRELSHILRPCIYGTIEEISLTLFNCNFVFCVLAASLLALSSSSKNGKFLKWVPLTISLSMDVYSKWPELNSSNKIPTESVSLIESEERSRRLLDFLYYPLRAPIYETFTANVLDSVEKRINHCLFCHPSLIPLKFIENYVKMFTFTHQHHNP